MILKLVQNMVQIQMCLKWRLKLAEMMAPDGYMMKGHDGYVTNEGS